MVDPREVDGLGLEQQVEEEDCGRSESEEGEGGEEGQEDQAGEEERASSLRSEDASSDSDNNNNNTIHVAAGGSGSASEDGGELASHVPLFKKHADQLDRLSIAGLSSAMDDLGLLSHRSEKESQDVVVATFATLDADKKNYLSADEFATLYDKAVLPTLADVLRKEHPEMVERLEGAFVKFATFGKRDRASSVSLGSVLGDDAEIVAPGDSERETKMLMGTPAFIKLLRDADLVKTSDDTHRFDVIFAKVKERGASKITFAQFVDALRLIAEGDTCGLDLMTLLARISEAAPSMNLTPRASPRKDASTTSSSPPKGRPIHIDITAVSSSDGLRDVFTKYARFGTGGANRRMPQTTPTPKPAVETRLSSQQFSKLARECGLVTRAVSAQKLDVFFASCKSKRTPRTLGISYNEFCAALELVAKEEGVMTDYVVNKVRGHADTAPVINSPALLQSPAGFVRLHDDERAHCGMYGRRLKSEVGTD